MTVNGARSHEFLIPLTRLGLGHSDRTDGPIVVGGVLKKRPVIRTVVAVPIKQTPDVRQSSRRMKSRWTKI